MRKEGLRSRRLEDYRESVDSRCATGIRVAVAVDIVSVGDVARHLIWAKTYAIRPSKAVGHNADIARVGVEAVHVLRQLGFGSEALLVAVNGVCEPDGAIGVDNDVVGGVEWTGVVVVY